MVDKGKKRESDRSSSDPPRRPRHPIPLALTLAIVALGITGCPNKERQSKTILQSLKVAEASVPKGDLTLDQAIQKAKSDAGANFPLLLAKLVDLLHNDKYFVKMDRRTIQAWLKNPSLAEEAAQMARQGQADPQTTANLRAFFGFFYPKGIQPQDIPFAVTTEAAVSLRFRDGCNTAAKIYMYLLRRAGVRDVRHVGAADMSDLYQACPVPGQRRQNVNINGHRMILVKGADRWYLVNETYYPRAEGKTYKIYDRIDGQLLDPKRLVGAQIEMEKPDRRFLITNVGLDADDTLGVVNREQNLNKNVSGNKDHPICRWPLR